MLTRRKLLGTAAVLVPGFALAACSGTQITASDLAGEVQFAADEFAAFVGIVATFGVKISQNVVDQVNKLANDVVTNAAGIVASLNQGDTLNKIAGFVTLAGNLLAPYYPAAPAMATAFNRVVKLLVDVATKYGFTLTKAAAVAA